MTMEKEEKTDFDRFWDVYPVRKGDRAKQPSKVLFDKAVKSGVSAEDIIHAAMQYAVSEKENLGTPFIMQAQRWLRNKRWLDFKFEPSQPSSSEKEPTTVFLREDTPQWVAWQRYLLKTKGKRSPMQNFGWWFPSEWPPENNEPGKLL